MEANIIAVYYGMYHVCGS